MDLQKLGMATPLPETNPQYKQTLLPTLSALAVPTTSDSLQTLYWSWNTFCGRISSRVFFNFPSFLKLANNKLY